MLHIYADMLDVIRGLRPVVIAIQKHDSSLADQLRRSATSAAANIGEGSGLRAGRRRSHYEIALGSARETKAHLDVAEAWGYVTSVDDALKASLLKVVNVLVANVERAR